MAVLAGFVPLPAEPLPINPWLSHGLNAFETDYTAWWPTRTSTVGMGSDVERGAHTVVDNVPVSMYPDLLSGTVPRAYSDDYYNRIHIIPTSIELGNLLSTQIRYFDVWNAYFVPRTLNAIVETDTDGLAISGPTAPLVYEALRMSEYELTILTSGPPVVDAFYTFDFDVGDYSINVTGSRVVLFTFQPDGPMVEELQWATDVMTSYNGTEQRSTVRGAPRQRLDFEVLTDEVEDAKLRALLFDWLPRTFGVPLWFEQRRVTSAVTAGAVSIPVTTAYSDFRVAGLVMIYENEDKYEVMGISSFTGSAITIEAPLLNSYTVKAVVMPVMVCYATSPVKRNVFPTGVAKTAVSFTVIDNVKRASTTGSTLYDSKVLLADANFMGDTLDETFDRQVTVVDTVSGRLVQTSGWDRSKVTTRKQWRVNHSLQEVWRIRQLLHALDGNRVSFWLPSFRPDLQLVETVPPNTPVIRVAGANYSGFSANRNPYRDIRITLTNGTIYTRRIVSSYADGSDDVLTLDSVLQASDLTVADVRRIEFVGLMRIANDKAKLTHYRAGTAQVDIQVSSVKTPSN